jgi:hypothetical protein
LLVKDKNGGTRIVLVGYGPLRLHFTAHSLGRHDGWKEPQDKMPIPGVRHIGKSEAVVLGEESPWELDRSIGVGEVIDADYGPQHVEQRFPDQVHIMPAGAMEATCRVLTTSPTRIRRR